MSRIILQVDESGKISEYKQPYTTIECATEEDFKRLEYLLNLGRATEKAFEEWPHLEGYCYVDEDMTVINRILFDNAQGLLEWAESEEK